MKKMYLFIISLFLTTYSFSQTPQINLVLVKQGFTSPVDIRNCGDGRIFIVEQGGKIRIMDKNGNINAAPFLDITSKVNSSGNEQGLLGLVFSPNYKQDGFFYINYINGSGSGVTRIARYHVSAADSNIADPASEQILLTFSQPYTNHNGGGLQFGPDGYLYDTQGDGGSADDPNGNGQNKNVYLAKILRLDVSDPDTTYTIPPTNPFVGQANAKGEVWAYGVRNPWRVSFDRVTGDLWIADVGQDVYEEIDVQLASSTGGENYGWRCREGMHACSTCTTSGCPASGYTDPVYEYSHSGTNGCSVTGGYVYRGAQYANLFGRYLFTDYCSGLFHSIQQTSMDVFTQTTLQDFINNQYTTFGEDNNGELYLAYRGTGSGGRIYRITETGDCNPVAFITLKDTVEGCVPYTLTALRGDTLNYQWYDVNGVINGANSYQYQVPQAGWYKVQVSKQQSGCQSMSDSVYVELRQATTITPNIGATNFCRNNAVASIAGYVSPSGGTFSGTGVSGANFVPVTASATNTITYNYTNQYGCASEYSFVLTVNDTTALTNTGTNNAFCLNEDASSLIGAVTPVGGMYSGSGVSNDTLFNPATVGVGTNAITYTYTDNNNCISATSFNITVADKTALAEAVPDSMYCRNGGTVALNGFVQPSGGAYSGTNVNSNLFDPSNASFGDNDVYYTYTNNAGCISVDTFAVKVTECVGINEVESGVSISIYPNPNNGVFQLHINSKLAQKSTVSIMDITGKVQMEKALNVTAGDNELPFNLTQLAKGVYTLQLKGHKLSATRRIVIE